MAPVAGVSPARLDRLPNELLIYILGHFVDACDVICSVRQTCRSLHSASSTFAVWRTQAGRLHSAGLALPGLPAPSNTLTPPLTAQDELASDLEWSVLNAERLRRRWDTPGALPRRLFRTRAHIDRITCLKLVGASPIRESGRGPGGKARRRRSWLVTGAVDGFVRVFSPDAELMGTPEEMGFSEGDSAAAMRDSNERPNDGEEDTSRCLSGPDGPPLPRPTGPSKRKRRQGLLAEIDTGGDVTAIDAELSEDGKLLHIAVGSYYSGAGCLVYALDVTKRPALLDLRGSLDPPHWCGTQCVSLRGNLVAVGTYSGLIHVFNWRSGWRSGIEREDRSSTAAVKLMGPYVYAVTRVGIVEVFELPSDKDAEERRSVSAEGRSPYDLPGNALLSLSDTMPPPIRSLDQRSHSGSREPLMRFAISEGNKPLLSVAFGEVDAARIGSLNLALLDDYLGASTQRAAVGLPLSLFTLDTGGQTHYVFDPLPALPPSNTSSDSDAARYMYAWPPRILSRQLIHGERPIGVACGSTGGRALMFGSLGGVPPVCCVRGYAVARGVEDGIDVQADEPCADARTSTVYPEEEDEELPPTLPSASQSNAHPGLFRTLRPIPGVEFPRSYTILEGHRQRRTSPIVHPAVTNTRSGAGSGSGAEPQGFHAPSTSRSASLHSGASSRSSSTTSSLGAAPWPLAGSSSSSSASAPTLHTLPTSTLPHPFRNDDAPRRSGAFETGPAHRADILTEGALNEEHGLVCLATARGNVWVADYFLGG